MVLIIILVYLAFISLGLPDSMLGACWPVMHKDIHASIEFAGYVGMIVSCGTVISSLMANRILHRFGTAKAVYTSIFLTVIALIGYAMSKNTLTLVFLAIPLGLGGGCIDSVLNNFVSLHLEAKHMNWLHCFWGLGACLGPGAVSAFIEQQNGWRFGYLGVGAVQLCIGLLIFFCAKIFSDLDKKSYGEKTEKDIVTNTQAIKIPFMKWNLFCWFCLCGGEIIGIAWTGSYVAIGKDFGPVLGALATSVYFVACTVSRIISGFFAIKANSYTIIRFSFGVYILGCLILFLANNVFLVFLGIILISAGNGPLYPSIMHETPNRFGKEFSGAVTGLQMAAAYTGSTLMTVVFGWIGHFNLNLYPYVIFLFLFGIIFSFFYVEKHITHK